MTNPLKCEGGEEGSPPTFEDCCCIIVNAALKLKCNINAELYFNGVHFTMAMTMACGGISTAIAILN